MHSCEIPWRFMPINYCSFDLLKRALYKRNTQNHSWPLESSEREMACNTLENFTKSPSIKHGSFTED